MTTMNAREAQAVLEELSRRAREKQGLDMNQILFSSQRKFVNDPSRLVAAKCSRRAGKSHGAAAKLANCALQFPGSTPLYVTMARERSKQIIWPALQELSDLYDLGMEFKLHTGEVRFPNGSTILMSGAGSKREVEKCRGLKYPVVVIDEAQVFSKDLFDYMVDEVFSPAVLDYRGQIVATGTPNAACAGAFFDITTGIEDGWSVHEWTLKDNPHLFKSVPDENRVGQSHEELLDEELRLICKRRGWTRQHPGFLREYLGMWVRDDSDLVFAIDPSNIYIPSLDLGVSWEYVLGVDVGFEDPMAFVVLAYSEDTGQVVAVESYTEEHMIPSQAAAEVERLMGRYPIQEVIVDTGGAGKGYAEEMKQRWNLPIEAAKKTDKAVYLEYLNGDLRSGSLKVLSSCRSLVQEMSLLQWNSRKKDRGIFDYDKSFADHQCDALLYGWRKCRHHWYDASHNPTSFPEELERERQKEMDDFHLFPEAESPWWKRAL